MSDARWHDLGPAEDFAKTPVHEARIGRLKLAITHRAGEFGAISGVCNHVGGPLGEGTIDGEYVVCPWHYYKFHYKTGAGEPGYEEDKVPSHAVRVENGRLLVDLEPRTKRGKLAHEPHPLARPVVRESGPIRVLGISTTAMDAKHPRYSTSEALLEVGLAHAREALGSPAKLIRLSDLSFRHCEGFYSKSAQACTWPCSITQMDTADQMAEVYEAIIHWSDVILVATPIRWGSASSLYFKMIERMNCVQNQITTHNRVLLKDKVASFVITGGQDNVQGVAGSLMAFFTELGCALPPFPFVAHSRGWTAEDMENNVRAVRASDELREGTRELVTRAVRLADQLLATHFGTDRIARGGRKAHRSREEGNARSVSPDNPLASQS